MTIVITAFIMVVALGVAAVLRLEAESRSEQFARLARHRAGRFAD